jgi:CMP-N,N'-diacetyllegionaminic acid synthase
VIDGKSVLAIIPARGGSKGLLGKNIRPMCGKPLIGWSIDKAKKCRYLDTILVTTDDQKIANIAQNFGAYVPFISSSFSLGRKNKKFIYSLTESEE